MRATGWKGGTYGVRVGQQNAAKFFRKNWSGIIVEIGGRPHYYALRSTFWTTCPEFRGAEIGDWLEANGLAPWRSGEPPDLELTPLGENRFKLSV